MLSVGRIYADSDSDDASTTGESSRPGGRRRVSAGWRYLWEQVAEGAEDYYSADVARGEAAGRWSGRAAGAELGLIGEVTEEQMERVFGRLMHPTKDQVLGQEARHFRSTGQRLAAAEEAHRRRWTAEWAQRQIELVVTGASAEGVAAEFDWHRETAGERWAEVEATIRRGGERAAVAGFDLTCSPPKSVSVLWAAADRDGREVIWRAHRQGVAAALEFVEREAAWSRTGYNGVRQVDTSGLVVASFDHRMSRAGDVQIHTHNAVLNRVRCDDGEWRTLDSRALYQVTAAAGAIYDRVREAALERDLGVRHEQRKPDGPREIVGVDDDLCRLFSTRRTQIEGRLAEMVAVYSERHGVAPSSWAVAQMSQWATLQTRNKKERTETTVEALARWESETTVRLGRSLAGVWDQAVAAGARRTGPAPISDDEALVAAIATVDADKATWTRYDLARQVTKNLYVDADVDAAVLLARVDRVVDTALGGAGEPFGVVKLTAQPVVAMPDVLRRRGDRASVYQHHGAERFSTDGGLAAERRVLAAARRRDGPTLDEALVDRCLAGERRPLSADQAQAVRQVLMSGRAVDALVGPAGTGKTRTMGAVARAWQAGGGQVLGLAVAETAARTLAADTGMATMNTAKLLFEHHHRSADEKTEASWRDQWAIEPGALVILDEAGMASRQVIDDLARLCSVAGAKLVLVGDPEQLAAPAAGGTFGLIVAQTAATTLSEVHRFAADWERRASLRLRAGDTGVLGEYDLRARIAGGDETEMETAAFMAAMGDRARGLATFLLADTNDAAARLAGRVREQRIAAGVVDPSRAVPLHDGNWASVGDRIVTRRNDRTNTAGQRFVANRDVWQVTDIGDDGTVTAARVDADLDQVRPDHHASLDADYVAEHVQLEYATTVHAAQGGTRASCHAVITDRTDRDALYVALTRGVQTNRAYVICNRPDGGDVDGPRQEPVAVLAAIMERHDRPDQLAAVTVQEESAERVRSLATLFPLWQDLIAAAGHEQWQTAVASVCGNETAAAMVAGAAWPTLAARLRVIDAAGTDSAAILAAAAGARTLIGVEDVAAVLHWRLRHAETAAAPLLAGTFTEISPAGSDDLAATIAATAAAMDARTVELAARVHAHPPAWAAQLGPVPDPDNVAAVVEWRRRAGVVAGYREAFGIDETIGVDTDPIGPAPPAGTPDAHAWWHRAAMALDRAEPAAFAALPDEHLEAVVEQARQTHTVAPPAVADQLRTVYTQLRTLRSAADHTVAPAGAFAPAAVHANSQIDALTATAAELEAAHRRREQWAQTTGRLHAQAEAATAELAGRDDARSTTPLIDRDVATLQTQLSVAEQQLAAANIVADQHGTAARNWQARVDQLNAQLAAGPPPALATSDTDVDQRQTNSRWVSSRQTLLDHAVARLRDSTDIAEPARNQANDLANRIRALQAELDHRDASPIPNPGWPAPGPDPDLEASDRTPPDALRAGAIRDPAGLSDTDRQPQPGKSERSTQYDMDLLALCAALAEAEQRLATITYIADRYGKAARRHQDSADDLAAQLAHVTTSRPYQSIAEKNVAISRADAARADQLHAALDRPRLALRGTARQNLTDELDQLLRGNAILRHPPADRQNIWRTILERATAKDHQMATELRNDFDAATADAAAHSAIAEPARLGIPAQTQRVATLRAELDHRTAAATTPPPHASAASAETAGRLAEILSPTPSVESRTLDTRPPKQQLRHEQMALPERPAPGIAPTVVP